MTLKRGVRHSKGFPASNKSIGWSIFDPDVLMPTAVLLQSAIASNSALFAKFCKERKISFAPHGKTTMSPELFDIQMRDGAWGITAATAFQARTMIEHGVPRVLIANEVVAPGDIAWVAQATRRRSEVICCVDSLQAVRVLEDGLAGLLRGRRVSVLVELGVMDGRTGARTVSEALVVARAVDKSSSLKLAGVSGFEGIISESQTQTAEQRVDKFLEEMRGLADAMIAENLFQGMSEILISAGGSVYFDRVATKLVSQNSTISERIVIRSGCYLSHDDGVIDQLSPYGSQSHVSGDVFRAALEVWGVVLSRPEPSRVIVGIGKRDVSTDGLLPIAKKILRRGYVQPQDWEEGTRAVRVDDQHLYLNVDASDEVEVGDLIGFGISHPCTTFDKWRAIPIANDKYQVVAIANTKF